MKRNQESNIVKKKMLIIVFLFLIAINIIILFIVFYTKHNRYFEESEKELVTTKVIKKELDGTNVSINNIEESMKLQGLWFIKNQTDMGDFIYEIDVNSGENLRGNNEVRQAGSLYSLAQLYRYTKDEEVEKTLLKGLTYFEKYIKPQNKSGTSIAITYNETTKSNTTALYLLALIEYMEASDQAKQEYSQTAKYLGNYLVSTQLNSGGYIYKYDNINNKNSSYYESDYNNGETFYSLVRLYKLTGNGIYIDSVNRAAGYLLQKYNSEPFNLSFYAWGMEGFAHLYDINPKEEYWNFMRSYTDSYMTSRGNYISRYFIDKGNTIPPKGNLGVYIEGLSHVAWIAKRKDPEYYGQIKTFIQGSLNYLMSLQINGPQSERSSSIESLKGGTCYDHECKTIRIDIVHHVLSANYLYLTLVK
jgi:hypothetical protein